MVIATAKFILKKFVNNTMLYLYLYTSTLSIVVFLALDHATEERRNSVTMRIQRRKNGSAMLTASMSQLWKHFQR